MSKHARNFDWAGAAVFFAVAALFIGLLLAGIGALYRLDQANREVIGKNNDVGQHVLIVNGGKYTHTHRVSPEVYNACNVGDKFQKCSESVK